MQKLAENRHGSKNKNMKIDMFLSGFCISFSSETSILKIQGFRFLCLLLTQLIFILQKKKKRHH